MQHWTDHQSRHGMKCRSHADRWSLTLWSLELLQGFPKKKRILLISTVKQKDVHMKTCCFLLQYIRGHRWCNHPCQVEATYRFFPSDLYAKFTLQPRDTCSTAQDGKPTYTLGTAQACAFLCQVLCGSLTP